MPPHRRPSFLSGRKAFSLVELSVVIVIISIVAVMGLEGAAIYMDRTAYNVTRDRLREIDDAIVAFKKVNGRLPCPSFINLPGATTSLSLTDSCIGKEYFSPGNCTAVANCGLGVITGTSLQIGEVPVRDLGLPISYMMDGYGDRFRYIITNGMGNSAALFNSTADAITIRSGKLATTCTTDCQDLGLASYVVYSHGRDRRNAITKNGVHSGVLWYESDDDKCKIDSVNARINASNPPSSPNCVAGKSVADVARNILYDSRYNAGSVPASYYDDIMIWRKKSDL